MQRKGRSVARGSTALGTRASPLGKSGNTAPCPREQVLEEFSKRSSEAKNIWG